MLKLMTALLMMVGAAAQSPPTDLYAEGQVWEYHTRPGEEGSLLKIQRIEPYPNAPAGDALLVYHISVIGARLGPQRVPTDLPHFPVSQVTLDASVTRRSQSEAAFPAPDEGIATWRADQGGVFTIPVAEIVAIVDHMVSGQQYGGVCPPRRTTPLPDARVA
jgi:hypothetical protein